MVSSCRTGAAANDANSCEDATAPGNSLYKLQVLEHLLSLQRALLANSHHTGLSAASLLVIWQFYSIVQAAA